MGRGRPCQACSLGWGAQWDSDLSLVPRPRPDNGPDWVSVPSLAVGLHARRGALTTPAALICPRLCLDSSSWSWTELGSLTKLTVRQTCQVATEGPREKMGALGIGYPTLGMWLDRTAWRQ